MISTTAPSPVPSTVRAPSTLCSQSPRSARLVRRCVTNVLRAAADSGGDVLELALHRPSLADVFFALTGHGLRDDDTPAAAAS